MMEVLLWEMQKLGYKTAVTQAGTEAARPQLLYTNMGFQVVDTNYQWFKILDGDLPLEIYKYEWL